MKTRISNLSVGLLGFVAGIAFLVSCGGGGGTGVSLPINNADANVPQITDQMLCFHTPQTTLNDAVIETTTTDTLNCMKQSTRVNQKYKSLAGVYAEGWVMVQMAGTFGAATFLFYK